GAPCRRCLLPAAALAFWKRGGQLDLVLKTSHTAAGLLPDLSKASFASIKSSSQNCCPHPRMKRQAEQHTTKTAQPPGQHHQPQPACP
ncbi:hypothetical protein CHARACLAT_009484, partial [Characodon lateralis]|nr:hypothetical protein [Characodon lateralis]